jgi:hypothetical protein
VLGEASGRGECVKDEGRREEARRVGSEMREERSGEALAKSTESDEELPEVDSNGSGYKQSGPHDGRSDSCSYSGRPGGCFCSRSRHSS